VQPFEPYSAIPGERLSQEIRRREGDRIRPTSDVGALASYWHAFRDFSYYEIYLEKPVGIPALVTQTGEKMVGGIVRFKELPGRLVLLPLVNLDVMVRSRKEEIGGGQAKGPAKKAPDKAIEASVGSQFVSALVDIDKTLRAHSERTPLPSWAQAGEYALAEEELARKQIADLDEQIATLEERKKAAQARLGAAGNLRGLLFESGKPLESAVLEALQILGFAAQQYKDGESEFDAVFQDPDGARLIGEVEGKNDKAINIEKLDQLERNVREEFAKTEGAVYAKPVLFGNAFRLSPPAARGNYFTEKCIAGAKRSGVALVRTPDLFDAAKYLRQNPDSAFANLCRRAILQTGGEVVKFPSPPAVVATEGTAELHD
jgi:flagellar motility protein MotE (MotC chaperone)